GRVGLTATAPGVASWQAVLAEALGTLLLMLTIMALAVDKRAPTGWAGFLIGLAVACEIMMIGPFTGGAVNPSRTFGPYLANQVFGGSTPWSLYWIYVVGPVAGAVLAAILYDVLVRPAREVPAPVGPAPEEAVTPGVPGQRAEEPAGGHVPADRSHGRHEVPGARVPGDTYTPTEREPREGGRRDT
ncbi:MAG TPA: aquaporin, partial [Pseudonocardia sp.]|nr:aquaporin [Pseudonocardia sp.]